MSWPAVRLGDVLKLDRTSVSPESIPSGESYVGLEHIEAGGAIVSPSTVVAGELKSAKFAFDRRHVLFGKLRPNLAKIARPAFDGICSTDIIPLLPGPSLDRDYLANFLLFPATVEWASSRTSGVNLPRLSPSVLSGLEIPLPPLPEQRRIASILDDVDGLRIKQRLALDLISDFETAIYRERFGAATEDWRVSLGSVAAIGSGSTPDRSRPDFFGDGFAWVKTTEVKGSVIRSTEETVSPAGMVAARLRVHPVGSVVIAMYGQGRTRGQSAVLGIPATVNQACAVVVPGSRLRSGFLAKQIALSYEAIRAKAQGGNQANLNLGIIGDLEVVVPPIELQDEFLNATEWVSGLQERVAMSLAKLDELFASLQSRAFRGKL